MELFPGRGLVVEIAGRSGGWGSGCYLVKQCAVLVRANAQSMAWIWAAWLATKKKLIRVGLC